MAVKAKAKSVTMGYCVQDSREYPSDRFYEHNNTELFPKGFVPYCKDCCNAMLNYYLQKTGTLEASMWYVCARLYMPFIRKVFEKAQSSNLVSAYKDWRIKDLETKLQIQEQNAKNAKSAIGSVTETGQTKKQEPNDLFLEGFDSD